MVKQRTHVSHPPDVHEKIEHLSHARRVSNPPKNTEVEIWRTFNGIELLQAHMNLCLVGDGFASKHGGDSQRSPAAPFPHGET